MKHTLNSQQTFPVGTTVKAYLASNWDQANLPPGGAPKGAVAAETVVAADGSIVFEGLAADIDYYAAGEVAAAWRYIHFRPSSPTPTAASLQSQINIVNLGTDWSAGEMVAARVSNPPSSHKLDLRDGTAAQPVKIGVTGSVSRVDATTRAEVDEMGPVGTDGPDGATAFRSSIKGTASCEVQVTALVGKAWQLGSSGKTGNDACPLYGYGRTSGEAKGTAFGAYLEAHREVAHRCIGLEVRNRTTTVEEENSYVPNGPSVTMGIWINAQSLANKKAAAAVQIGAAFGAAYDVGLAANEGAIVSAFLRDDSSGKVSLDIWGSHETAAVRIKNGSGAVLIGTQSLTETNTQLLEVHSQGTNRNPALRFSANANVSHTILFNNTAANFNVGQSGGAGNLATGTENGDAVLSVGSSRKIHLGRLVAEKRLALRVGVNVAIGAQADSTGEGEGVIFISNAATAPKSNPANGGILFVEGGALKYRGSSGTVTTLAAA